MEKIKKNIDYLNILSCCNTKMRKSVIANGSKELIDSICECVLNLLVGNVKFQDDLKKKLYKHKKPLRKLLQKVSLKDKKKILIQNGGFLLILLPSFISGLASIIGSVISNSKE